MPEACSHCAEVLPIFFNVSSSSCIGISYRHGWPERLTSPANTLSRQLGSACQGPVRFVSQRKRGGGQLGETAPWRRGRKGLGRTLSLKVTSRLGRGGRCRGIWRAPGACLEQYRCRIGFCP